MRGALIACLLAGCQFDPGVSPDKQPGGDGGPVIDAPPDGPPIDAAVSMDLCFGAAPVTICFAQPLTNDLTITTQTLDTGGTSCMSYTSPTGANVCVLAGRRIVLESGTTLTGRGSKPLVLVSASSIYVANGATIDVSSKRNGQQGAGSDMAGCMGGSLAGGTTSECGGGWGGSFGAKGGNGGDGDLDNGGNAGSAFTPTTLRGGCPGGDGGNAVLGGSPGHGGGAVALIAYSQLVVAGVVNASGAAGDGGDSNVVQQFSGGGGGGGSGGMIRLDSMVISVSGQVFANGGGGGEGASSANGGNPGKEATAPNTGGAGGNGGAGSGGDGGMGSVGSMIVGITGSNGSNISGSGGGGGGSAGVIQVIGVGMGTMNTLLVAPPPT